MKLVLLPLPVALVVLLAFPAGQFWHMPASGDTPVGDYYDVNAPIGNNRAGAGGIYGTGGQRDYGIKCSDCHTSDETPSSGSIDANITTDVPWQDVNGEPGYSPGQTYVFTVELLGEHRGVGGQFGNTNGFGLSIEDANGAPVGVLIADSGMRSDSCVGAWPGSPPDPNVFTTIIYGDCHAVLFSGVTNDRTTWTFDWIAPPAGTGPVTIYYSVVDGDTAAESSLGDDVKEGTIPLLEGT